MLRNEISKLLI